MAMRIADARREGASFSLAAAVDGAGAVHQQAGPDYTGQVKGATHPEFPGCADAAVAERECREGDARPLKGPGQLMASV